MRPRLGAVLLCAVLAPSAAAAQPFPLEQLPPELRPWVGWVLDEVPDHGCPRVQGRAVCLWPGRLRLELGASGGGFALDVRAERATELRLPGDGERWPQDVTLDGVAAAVVDRGGSPTVGIGPGRHRVGGRFAWSRGPESLRVPPEVGLIELKLDGRAVRLPRREADGLLWLRAAEGGAGGGESLRLQVFRRIADGIPLFSDTQLALEVSGKAREVVFEGALLASSVPVAVSGDLPARLDGRGRLHVQVRAGRFTVSVRARIEGSPREISRPAGPAGGEPAWPAREVWVFATDETLRQVEIAGAPPIDPSRTELPAEWRALPAFLMEPGSSLTLAERRRGEPEAPPDRLSLVREMWLDPSGRSLTVRDRFSGTLSGTTRLDLLAPGELGRVSVDGQDQLVTANPQTSAAGVELRRSALALVADSRLPREGALRAVGWSARVEQLQARLHLPPGWTLLAGRGVDRLPGSWTSRWTLLGFFFVLITTLAVHRLLGPRFAVLALAALVLSYGEPGAPFVVWLSLLGAMALRGVAPTGRLASLARIWWLASAGTLLLMLVPFTRDQIRDALYPLVAPPRQVATGVEGGVPGGVVGTMAEKQAAEAEDVPAAAPPTAPVEEPIKARAGRVRAEESVAQRLPSRYAYNVALEQDPKAVLQTGPGVPSWQWQSYALTWSGPVGPDHRMRVLLASPGVNRLLTLARLALLGFLTAVLLAAPGRPRWPAFLLRSSTTAALLVLVPVPPIRADSLPAPSPQLLEELKKRLTRAEPCAPACTTTARLILRIDGQRLAFQAEVHAAAEGAWPVPGPLESWVPAELRLDGQPTVAVARLADGFLHVRLGRGVHRLEATGPVPPADSFTLQLADRPRRARVEAPGWEVVGLREDGPADGSIQITRRLGARAREAEGVHAPWLEVTRTLGLGLNWTVTTEVRRVSPLGTPVALRIPLLRGEAPTDAGVVVEGREVAVSLGREEASARWSSTLERAESLTLEAPAGRPWSEVWRLRCGVVWACEGEGLPPVRRIADGLFEPEFRPWPGETLTVKARHPRGIEGQTLTLDAVHLAATPGVRLEQAELTLYARSSREQGIALTLPAGADVQDVSVDGASHASRPQDGRLHVTVPAGAHRVLVRWQQERGMRFVYDVPRVGLPGPAVNVALALTVPPNRWLLLTRGPAWGPAVLFWPYLLFVLAAAFVLGRVPGSPLRSGEWALLGLGLSQIPAAGALVVAVFFFALAWRQRRPPRSAVAFDALQVLLFSWALVSLALLYVAIETGLLFRPNMQVAGNDSTDTALRWYADRVEGALPHAGVVSLPLWTYKIAMLCWALWLAASLLRWAGWAWRAWGEGGVWRRLGRKPSSIAPDPGGPPASPRAGGESGPVIEDR